MQALAGADLARLLTEALAPLSPADIWGFWGPRRIAVAVAVAAGVAASSISERGPRCSAPEQALAGHLAPASMVSEFPELRGVMGGYYARHDGEDGEVAKNPAEHYQPKGPTDPVPESATGATGATGAAMRWPTSWARQRGSSPSTNGQPDRAIRSPCAARATPRRGRPA